MTGRRLYDALTDAWAQESAWARDRNGWLRPRPPAWSFLEPAERSAFNRAAGRLTPRRSRRRAETDDG